MRRTNRCSVLGALAGLVFATSCDSFLDPSPSDVLTPENFYKTSSDAVSAVVNEALDNAIESATRYWHRAFGIEEETE